MDVFVVVDGLATSLFSVFKSVNDVDSRSALVLPVELVGLLSESAEESWGASSDGGSSVTKGEDEDENEEEGCEAGANAEPWPS